MIYIALSLMYHTLTAGDAEDKNLVAFTPTTAERVGQIISSQTSLSKELQSKLPRVGESIGGSGNGAEPEEESRPEDTREELEDIKEEVEDTKEDTKKEVEADLPVESSTEDQTGIEGVASSTGTDASLDLTSVAVATISTNLSDLPEEFSAEWKLEEDERQRALEEKREERRMVRESF